MSIQSAINMFEGITLAQMDSVKLMNRTDRKYWFNTSYLEEILSEIRDDYYALQIDSERSMPYATRYYDTDDDQMYMNHHRGKLNRYKIRRRSYESTQSSFLEVKFKNNKGRTIKKRIEADYDNGDFDAAEDNFITRKSPYCGEQLHEVLVNSFNRLMLVSKDMRERCTIDQELRFISNGVEIKLEGLVVVEVKSEGRAPSNIISAMNRRRLRPSGFSKYCMGRSITDPLLRNSRFRMKHRYIEKNINRSLEQLINPI